MQYLKKCNSTNAFFEFLKTLSWYLKKKNDSQSESYADYFVKFPIAAYY